MTGLTREEKISKYKIEEKIKEMESNGAVVDIIDYGKECDIMIAEVK